MNPKVTIICIAYNHADFIREALESVFRQTYDNIELIVLDDGSSDQSVEVIEQCTDSLGHE